MKKIICCALTGLLLLAGGCSGSQSGEGSFPPEQTVRALLDSGAFSETLEDLDADIAVMLFNLEGDASEYEGTLLYYSTGATSETAAVIVAQDAETAKAAKETLSDWVDAQIEAERNYQPAEVEKLEHAILEVRGSTVLLVVAADWNKAAEAVPAQ